MPDIQRTVQQFVQRELSAWVGGFTPPDNSGGLPPPDAGTIMLLTGERQFEPHFDRDAQALTLEKYSHLLATPAMQRKALEDNKLADATIRRVAERFYAELTNGMHQATFVRELQTRHW